MNDRLLRRAFPCLVALVVAAGCDSQIPSTGAVGSANGNALHAPSPSLQSPTVQAATSSRKAVGLAPSFGSAQGRKLVVDADFAKYIDPQVTGKDRQLAIQLMRLMPARMRGDFAYVDSDGRVLSNRLSVARAVRFEPQSRAASMLEMGPDYTPPTDTSTGPFVREYSQTGVSAAWGYATVGCGNTGLDPGDGAYMYNGVFNSSGANMDVGLEYYTDSKINAFIRLNGVWNPNPTGWTNQSYAYSCGQHIAVAFGTLNLASPAGPTGVLITGIPTTDPTQQQLPPSMTYLQNSIWNFFPLKSNLWTSPGNWNGYPTPCTGCVAKRMTTIGLATGHTIDTDDSCFGACNGSTTNWWDQIVMGQLISPCTQTQNVTYDCTIQYFPDSSWFGGLQQEPSADYAASYSPSGSENQYQEGINMDNYYSSGAHKITKSAKFHVYATPSPQPSHPPVCGASQVNVRHRMDVGPNTCPIIN